MNQETNITAFNPRYTLYAKAFGNDPDQQLDVDKRNWPGGCMTGFIIFIGRAWRVFAHLHRCNHMADIHLLIPDVDRQFDIWLAGQVANGLPDWAKGPE